MGQFSKSTDDWGVSEALGFMLIFTLVIVGIGLVTLYGYPMLLQQQTSADEQIMQKNMIVLQNDVKSITYKMVPYKETSLKIGGGTLFSNSPLSDPTAPTFTIWDSNTGSGNPWVDNYRSGDLRYESTSAQTDISLQNGAVVMRKRVEPGSVILTEPRWFYDEETNTMVISLIVLNNTETLSRAGIGTVQMVMHTAPEIVLSPMPLPPPATASELPAGTTIWVSYDPGASTDDYSVAWNNYFINTMKMTDQGLCGIPTATARCYSFRTDVSKPAYLVIKKFEVTIQSL